MGRTLQLDQKTRFSVILFQRLYFIGLEITRGLEVLERRVDILILHTIEQKNRVVYSKVPLYQRINLYSNESYYASPFEVL